MRNAVAPVVFKAADADIIDYPVYGNFSAVPFQVPGRVEGDESPVSDEQWDVFATFEAWAVKMYLTAKASGRSWEEASALLYEHVGAFGTPDGVPSDTSRSCEKTFGMTSERLAEKVQGDVTVLLDKGMFAVEMNLASELNILADLKRAYARIAGFDSRRYDAYHGGSPDRFRANMANAFDVRPGEELCSSVSAVQLAHLSGVNMALVWQDQWMYRLVLGTAAALNPWTRRKAAHLLPYELYVLYRCVEDAAGLDRSEYRAAKRYIANLVGDRKHFLRGVKKQLSNIQLLPKRPLSARQLIHHCGRLIGNDGQCFGYVLPPPK